MTIGNGKETTGEQITLRSRTSELSRVGPWIEFLASRYAIPERTRFAMNLCLEEVLSNIIRHGYAAETDGSMTVQFARPREGHFVITVEDEAPPFNPVQSPELPALNPSNEVCVGGQGIRLLRRFADSLEYQATPTGNRLRMGFAAAGSVVQRD